MISNSELSAASCHYSHLQVHQRNMNSSPQQPTHHEQIQQLQEHTLEHLIPAVRNGEQYRELKNAFRSLERSLDNWAREGLFTESIATPLRELLSSIKTDNEVISEIIQIFQEYWAFMIRGGAVEKNVHAALEALRETRDILETERRYVRITFLDPDMPAHELGFAAREIVGINTAALKGQTKKAPIWNVVSRDIERSIAHEIGRITPLRPSSIALSHAMGDELLSTDKKTPTEFSARVLTEQA